MRTARGHTSALALVAVAGLIAIAAQEQIPLWEAANPVRPLPHSPLGIDSKLTDVTNAPTPQRVRLGRWLFYDKRLSADATIACATCHRPEHAFSEPTPVSTGIRGQKGAVKRLHLSIKPGPCSLISSGTAAQARSRSRRSGRWPIRSRWGPRTKRWSARSRRSLRTGSTSRKRSAPSRSQRSASPRRSPITSGPA